MTAREFIAQHEHQLVYGPAYRPDTAPFPEAVTVAPLPMFPAARPRRPKYTTSSARRPRPSFVARIAAALSL